MDAVRSSEEKEEESRNHQPKPKPDEFDVFIPWACVQLLIDVSVIVNKVCRADYVNAGHLDRHKPKQKSKSKLSLTGVDSTKKNEDSSDLHRQLMKFDKIVKIIAYYNSNQNLVEIKFENNLYVPSLILKIIGLILPFHTHLYAVTINRGLDEYVMYELQKWLPITNITDVCLDNTFFTEAKCDILLKSRSQLRQLSLARCRIDDKVCENLASKIVYTQPGSHSLMVLNLSSNRITDLGAKYLAGALRSNRKLTYLNLAGNMIGDDGASSILNSLQEFPLSSEELQAARSRHLVYLKKRDDLLNQLEKELRAGDFDKKAARRKSAKAAPVLLQKKAKTLERDQSLRNVNEPKSSNNVEAIWHEKAQVLADSMNIKFEDPFNSENSNIQDGVVYCAGNNTLCYLNFSYNNLSFLSLKKLLNVLVVQKSMDRTPRGLLNVMIEGNYMPKYCIELTMIDQIIDEGLIMQDTKISGKKKPQSKTGK